MFDDLIACGEHLLAEGIATAETLGIRGGSNGGLLTAATMLQRPDLFGAVISQVPVIDMLRFQHFTAGRFWTVEYGDAADPEAFEWLIEYSPLHNVESGVEYPPLLIMTAESDDRVVPMHAHKFAAEIQHQAGGGSEQPYSSGSRPVPVTAWASRPPSSSRSRRTSTPFSWNISAPDHRHRVELMGRVSAPEAQSQARTASTSAWTVGRSSGPSAQWPQVRVPERSITKSPPS